MPFDIPEQTTVRDAIGQAYRLIGEGQNSASNTRTEESFNAAMVFAQIAQARAISDLAAAVDDVADKLSTIGVELGSISIHDGEAK